MNAQHVKMLKNLKLMYIAIAITMLLFAQILFFFFFFCPIIDVDVDVLSTDPKSQVATLKFPTCLSFSL